MCHSLIIRHFQNRADIDMWKAIAGYEGIYEVSTDGLVRSVPRLRKAKGNHTLGDKVQGRILKAQLNRKGYEKVRLYRTHEDWKQFFVHRVVAQTFIPNPENLPQVNHKDGDKRNNKVSNLEWITNTENMRHAYSTGVRTNPSGAKHGNAKLTEDQVRLVVKLRSEGHTYRRISEIVGCKLETAQSIVSGHQWSTVTGIAKRPRSTQRNNENIAGLSER